MMLMTDFGDLKYCWQTLEIGDWSDHITNVKRQNLSTQKCHPWPELSPANCQRPIVTSYKSPLSRCQQHLIDPVLSLMILFSYLRRLLHKKSGRWVWCCPILQAFIKKDWEGESCSISFYIHCLLHLLLGLLYGLVKWTSNMDWQPKNNILRTRGWIWERIAYHDWSANQKNATKSLKTAILTD